MVRRKDHRATRHDGAADFFSLKNDSSRFPLNLDDHKGARLHLSVTNVGDRQSFAEVHNDLRRVSTRDVLNIKFIAGVGADPEIDGHQFLSGPVHSGSRKVSTQLANLLFPIQLELALRLKNVRFKVLDLTERSLDVGPPIDLIRQVELWKRLAYRKYAKRTGGH